MIRFLARFLRGPSKPRQLYAATILGAMLAFVPDYAAQPGWAFLILVALSASGANLPLAAIVFVPAYLVKLVAMPVSFAIGQFLLDGPTSGFFRQAVNAPFSALLGFEYYPFARAVKFSLRRPVGAGGPGDFDCYGAQQHAPLLGLKALD